MSEWALTEQPRLRRPTRLKYDSVRETELLLLPERVVSLNATAGAILRLCDGERTVAQIIGELEARYGASGLASDIVEFLSDAADRGWVEPWR